MDAHDAYLQELGKRIRQLQPRFATLAEMADTAGVTTEQLRKWKLGRANPSFSAMVRLADAAGVSVDWLAHGGTAPGPGSLNGFLGKSPGHLNEAAFRLAVQWSQDCIGDTKLDLTAKRQAELISVLYDVLVDAIEVADTQGGDPAALAKADLTRRLCA